MLPLNIQKWQHKPAVEGRHRWVPIDKPITYTAKIHGSTGQISIYFDCKFCNKRRKTQLRLEVFIWGSRFSKGRVIRYTRIFTITGKQRVNMENDIVTFDEYSVTKKPKWAGENHSRSIFG